MDQLTSRALSRADSAILPPDHFFQGLPRNAFRSALIDPPWAFTARSEKGLGRSAERHYRTMRLDEIADLPVADLMMPDSFVWLWVTAPFLAAGHHVTVLKAWGFKPSSIAFAWVKTNDSRTISRAQTWDDVLFAGMGFTTRQNVEVVVLGRRGSPKRVDKAVRQVVVAPVRTHSEKPEEIARRIERFCEGPHVELFARRTRSNWISWGDEAGKLDDVA